MRLGPYLEKLDQALWINRILQVIILAMAIAILALARQRTIVHVAPPEFKTAYDIGESSASREYIEQMAGFLLTNALTINPDSADYAARSFLRFLSPDARGRLETAILGDATWVKKQQMSQAFYPRILDFQSPTKLRITGTLVQWVAGKVVTSRDAAYDLTVQVKNYSLQIKDFAYVTDEPRHATNVTAAPAVDAPAPAAQ